MKHLGRVLGISSLIIAAMAATSFGQGWGLGPVIVFDQRDGNGNASSFNVGEYRSGRGEFGSLRNDSAYSVTVPNGFRVRFCENEGSGGEGSGRCEEYNAGNHNLRYAGSASYLRVWGPTGGWNGGWNGGDQRGVTVYEDRDYRGRSQQFGIGRHLNMGGGLGSLRNDSASSIVVDRGFRARLCENEGNNGRGSGRCEDYSQGSFNLRYDNSASFIEVQRVGGWGNGGGWGNNDNGGWNDDNNRGDRVIVYADANQRGTREDFNVGVYRVADGQFGRLGNDTASSIFIPQGMRVRLCEHEGRNRSNERCEDYTAGRYNLRYNDVASSIEVRRGNGDRWQIGDNNNGGWNDDDGGWNGNNNGVIVYSNPDQRGQQQFFGIGTYRADQNQLGQVGNDNAASVWVANGFRVQLCENEPRGFFGNVTGSGSGRCEEYGPGRHNLRYRNSASFIRVWR